MAAPRPTPPVPPGGTRPAGPTASPSADELVALALRGPVGILVGEGTAILWANDAFLGMVGYGDADVAAGLDWSAMTPPEWEPVDRTLWANFVQCGGSPFLEKEYFHRDGHRVPVRIGGTTIARDPFRWICYVEDLTELHTETTTDLAADAVVEAVPSPVVVLDRDGRIELFNRACEDLTGYDRTEVLGRSLLEVVVPDDEAPELLAVLAELAGGAGRLEHEFDWRTRSGHRRRIACALAAVASGGSVTHVVAVGVDVTERRLAEAELLRAQRMEALGRLAGGAAHDFNNLLAVMRLHLERLEADTELAAPTRERLDRLGAAVDRAADLVHSLLTFARHDRVEASVVSVHEHLRALAPVLQDLLGGRVQLELRLDAPDDRVRIAPVHLEQVIANLAVNARDAMPRGGRLTVTTSGAAGDDGQPALTVEVRDTGVGMDRATLERVFEPFFTTKGDRSGTGLGLSTTYAIVTGAGGTITAHSEVGQGTTFSFRLPLASAAAPASPAAPAPPTQPAPPGQLTGPGRPLVVLVVDDEAELRDLVAQALTEHGHQVHRAQDSRSALAAARRLDRLDVLVTDLVLPGRNGAELARLVRRGRPGLPVVAMSGFAATEAIEQLPPDVTVLSKPFSIDELLVAVARSVRAPGRGAGQGSKR